MNEFQEFYHRHNDNKDRVLSDKQIEDAMLTPQEMVIFRSQSRPMIFRLFDPLVRKMYEFHYWLRFDGRIALENFFEVKNDN